MTGSPEPNEDLPAALAGQFPAVPLQSVVQCVWDAQVAVEFAAVDAGERDALVARLARAHLEELAPLYAEQA